MRPSTSPFFIPHAVVTVVAACKGIRAAVCAGKGAGVHGITGSLAEMLSTGSPSSSPPPSMLPRLPKIADTSLFPSSLLLAPGDAALFSPGFGAGCATDCATLVTFSLTM